MKIIFIDLQSQVQDLKHTGPPRWALCEALHFPAPSSGSSHTGLFQAFVQLLHLSRTPFFQIGFPKSILCKIAHPYILYLRTLFYFFLLFLKISFYTTARPLVNYVAIPLEYKFWSLFSSLLIP